MILKSNFLSWLGWAIVDIWESPGKAALAAGFVYLLISAFTGRLSHQSDYPYYNYLAEAFLHGQFSLVSLPPKTLDLVFFSGKYYLYWSPFPALVILPFVAIFGTGFNDVLFTDVVGAVNIGLFALLLRAACKQEFLFLSKKQRSILTLFLALGTVHVALAPLGNVWHTGQLIGFTCTLLAYLVVFNYAGPKAWFLMGLALTGAMLTRNQMIFTGIFPVIYLLQQEKSQKLMTILRNMLVGSIPIFIGLIFYLYYNQARFGNILDTGLAYHQMSEFFREDFSKYGVFNIHYIPRNIYYQYIYYPLPFRTESYMGGSLFLLSPLFFGVFSAFHKMRSRTSTIALLASIFITNIPILLLMGTGAFQFGPRYTLDFTVPLMLLTALGIERWNSLIIIILASASVLQYLFSAPFYI